MSATKYSKKIKSEVLYDDFYDYDRFHHTKQFLAEQDTEEYCIDFEEAYEGIDDSRVWEQLEFENDIYYDDAKKRIEELVGGRCLLVVGNIGTWRGNFDGGKVYSNFTEFARYAFRNAYNIRIEIEDGILKVEVGHHDGTDNYSIKMLKDRGEYAYNYWDTDKAFAMFWKLTEQEMHQKLFEKPYYSAFFKEVA